MPRSPTLWAVIPLLAFFHSQTFCTHPVWQHVAGASQRNRGTVPCRAYEPHVPPADRLANVWDVPAGRFEEMANAITASKTRLPEWFTENIREAAAEAGITKISEISLAGSELTRTAIRYSSDLDVNVNTVECVTRSQRSKFKDFLVSSIVKRFRNWEFEHMGKKCIVLIQTNAQENTRVDIAFVNTCFDTIIDRGENVGFFRNNKAAQQAVRMFKLAFLDVSGLCGFHIERLAMKLSEAAGKQLEGRVLWTRMLREVRKQGPSLRLVMKEALLEVEDDQKDAREAQLHAQVTRMRNVVKDAGVFGAEVISHLCDSPGGPSTIAVLLPGVHGGVGPCREPGSNFDANCLYALVAQRLQELGRAIDVYRCSWQFMCPTMAYALNAVCHVLQHALKQAQRRGSHAINVVIVGHSLGGQVALHSAAMLARLKEEGHLFLEKGESSMEVTGEEVCLNEGKSEIPTLFEAAPAIEKRLFAIEAEVSALREDLSRNLEE
ncbi:unnamed protein product, partial [Symbiodinium necroappetens]